VYNVFGEEINKKSSIYLNTDAKEFNFKADTVEYDSKNDVIIAKGNVVITHDGDIITADKLLINKKNNLVFAEGNIYYKDKNKNDVYADSLELSEDMGKIVINNVSMLIENNYLYADKLTNKDNTTNLINSCFTLCKINYHSRPFVSTKAKKATYNEKTQILTL
jgi:lipopolysaccharide assembly outer membrane protein LptD (OstA)